MRAARKWQLAAGLAAALWVAIILMAPPLAFAAGHFICHQRPERSFVLHGRQLPVCARCTGLYAGAAIAGPMAIVLGASIARRRARLLLSAAAVPTLITWSLEFAGVVPFSNAWRFVAALPLGFAAAWLVLGEIGAMPDE
jgi:uncharacterized membrane protein